MRMKKTAMKSGSKKTDQNQKKSWVWVATAQLCVHLREWSVCVCLLQTCKLVVFTSYLSYKLSGVSQWQVMVFRGSPASRDKVSWTKPCRWIWHVVPVRSNPTGAATQHTGGDMKVVCLKVHNDEDWRCKYLWEFQLIMKRDKDFGWFFLWSCVLEFRRRPSYQSLTASRCSEHGNLLPCLSVCPVESDVDMSSRDGYLKSRIILEAKGQLQVPIHHIVVLLTWSQKFSIYKMEWNSHFVDFHNVTHKRSHFHQDSAIA